MKRNTKPAFCKECNEPFHKEHNRQMYCSDKCRKEARAEQNRTNRLNYYYRWKDVLKEKPQRGSMLGTGSLWGCMSKNWCKELKKIRDEKTRLGL